MTLTNLRDALLALGVPVYHYRALKQPPKYIVWAEDSQGSSNWGDNVMIDQALEGTVDFFTKTEYDPTAKSVQDVLNCGKISWRLNSLQYEEDTGYIHYEWVWRGLTFG